MGFGNGGKPIITESFGGNSASGPGGDYNSFCYRPVRHPGPESVDVEGRRDHLEELIHEYGQRAEHERVSRRKFIQLLGFAIGFGAFGGLREFFRFIEATEEERRLAESAVLFEHIVPDMIGIVARDNRFHSSRFEIRFHDEAGEIHSDLQFFVGQDGVGRMVAIMQKPSDEWDRYTDLTRALGEVQDIFSDHGWFLNAPHLQEAQSLEFYWRINMEVGDDSDDEEVSGFVQLLSGMLSSFTDEMQESYKNMTENGTLETVSVTISSVDVGGTSSRRRGNRVEQSVILEYLVSGEREAIFCVFLDGRLSRVVISGGQYDFQDLNDPKTDELNQHLADWINHDQLIRGYDGLD